MNYSPHPPPLSPRAKGANSPHPHASLSGEGRSVDARYRWGAIALILSLVAGLTTPSRAQGSDEGFLRPTTACPMQVEPLVALMLRDLPSYANRVNQRSLGNFNLGDRPGYVIITSPPEFEPLALGPGVYESTPTTPADTPQVFFTTLERQYVDGEPRSIQQHHWLFLTQTSSGWRMVMLLSHFATYETSDRPLSPPQDASQGVIAQAIRQWLDDCRHGDIYPPES